VPFNGGAGGAVEPVAGASGDGFSNFFPRPSPDGKWIVFCKARNYMLLQPDSELYIVPAAGGTARRMRCNTSRMNSWHSWSPDGRWLVFASKANGPYTQLWLTRVDEEGNDAPAVALERLTAPDRAANIPEFVNLPVDALARIREAFMDDVSYLRAGTDQFNMREWGAAESSFRRALEINPTNPVAHFFLGSVLAMSGRAEAAGGHFASAEKTDPKRYVYPFSLGKALRDIQRIPDAVEALRRAVALGADKADAHAELGRALFDSGRMDEAKGALMKAVALDPDDVPARYSLAMVLFKAGEFKKAVSEGRKAAELAVAAGRHDQAREIRAAVDAMVRAAGG
jgi:tetratricopeptide (TPR) repeat protein